MSVFVHVKRAKQQEVLQLLSKESCLDSLWLLNEELCGLAEIRPCIGTLKHCVSINLSDTKKIATQCTQINRLLDASQTVFSFFRESKQRA